MGHVIPIIIIIKPKFANSAKSKIEEKKLTHTHTHTHTHSYKISPLQVFCQIRFELKF